MIKKEMKTIRHYGVVYREFIKTSFSQAASFRLHFILLILMDLFFYFSSLMSVDFIFNHVEQIGPWKRDQLMFFISVMLAIDQWHMTFISESFWELSHHIRTGSMDFILMRPIGSLFVTFFRNFRPSSLFNLLITWGIIFYFGQKCHLTYRSLALLPFLMILGFALLVQIEIIISCSMFWMLEGVGINFLRMEMQKLARWPDFIYGRISRKFFLVVVPVLLVGNAPVRFLFNPTDWVPLMGLILSNILIGIFLSYLWPKALRHYESASS